MIIQIGKKFSLLIISFFATVTCENSKVARLRRKRLEVLSLNSKPYDDSTKENAIRGTELKHISTQQKLPVEVRSIEQRQLFNNFGRVPLNHDDIDASTFEELASMMKTMDLSMSYVATPTAAPTKAFPPTMLPTEIQTVQPTSNPSQNPTLNLSNNPTILDSTKPSREPSEKPSTAPSTSPSTAPSVNCASPTARENDIRKYAESIASPSKTTDPSTPQYEAIQWLLNTDSNTNACDGLTSISRRYGLAMLYFSTNGTSWTNSTGWLDTLASECAWHGISCNANSSFIEEINLAENKVTGSIPDEFFYSMPSLTNISFYNNEVTGTLPVSIGSLTQLSLLDMEQNKLTGPLFTPELFNLKNTLSKLWVSFNEFEDEIPPTISQFNMLENLWAAGNKLYGTLPTELGMLNSMTKLLIYNNTFSGTIPSEFGNLRSSLQWIDARNSSLIGTIPEELYELTKLERLILSKNSLSGTVSSKLSSLVVLEQLFLNDNMFSGLLPDLTGASRMKNLDVKNNNFSGVLPDVSQWSALKSIDVSNNELFGTVPPSFFDNKLKLELAYFSNNSFVGTIPSNYFSPPKLRDLYFDGNMLTGQIPSPALDGLESMEELLFQNNDLIGIMPDDLCTIKTSNNSTFLNLFADCFPDPNNGNSVQLSCPIGCCNKCFI